MRKLIFDHLVFSSHLAMLSDLRAVCRGDNSISSGIGQMYMTIRPKTGLEMAQTHGEKWGKRCIFQ